MDVEVPTPPPASRTNQVTSNPPNILKPQIKTKTSVFGTANGLPFNQKSLKEVQMNSKPHSSPLMKPSSDDNTESDVIEKTLKRYNLMTDDQPKPKKVALNGRRMNTIAKKPISGATVGANGSATSSNPPSPPKNDLSLPQVNAKQNNNTGKATIATKQQATKPTLTKPAKAPVDAPLPKIRSFQEIMRAKRAGEFRQNGQTSASEQKTPSPPQAPVDTPPAKSAANVSQGLAKAKTVEPVSQNNKESNHLSVSNQPNYNQGALNNNQQPSLISQPVATTSQTTQLSKSPVLLSESKNSLVAQQPVRPATTSPKQSSKALSASSTESTNSNLSIHNTDANKETDTPTTSTVLIDLTKRNQEPAMPQTLSTSSSKPTQPVPSTPLRKPEVVPTFSTPRTEEFRRFNLQFEEEMKALRNNLPFSGPLSFENAHGTTHRDTVYYELQEQFARDMAALRSKSPLN
ncbi:hypothetical protein H4219_002120 [Mycoemilia scoparia]|uniref:Uncharacterized protein n=1 Tax=Mycoemilia scoparia TaxID=417184 RepID=A0A9W8A435_9FUNG|nr:hypothetical protein H4219_002120 [Mycoemilia scoparia]